MTSLLDLQKQAGAVFSPEGNTLSTFNQESQLLDALDKKLIVCDRSNWGLLSLAGDDRARFLHNQTTNNIESLKTGQGCETVFVNSTGRTIDLVTAYIQEKNILLLVSPEQNEPLYQWMDRYIFPFDKVELKDLTAQYSIFTLIGKSAEAQLGDWFPTELLNTSVFGHKTITIDDVEVTVTVDSGLSCSGYNFIVATENAGVVWQKLTSLNPVLIGEKGWETLRIAEGRPKPPTELTTDYNPLEAGLWRAISFDKGCYIGQETIARLNTYQGVKQRLWGIELDGGLAPEDGDRIITIDGEKIGIVTSYDETENKYFALGYVRTKAGGEDLQVKIGEVTGKVVSLPFVKHEYYQPEAKS